MLEFRVLGPVEALDAAARVDLGGPQQRAVLALLLVRANEVVPRERLISDLWDDSPPATARETLKVYIGRLRKVFAQNGGSARLTTRGPGYVLEVDPEQIDLVRFQRLLASGTKALGAGDAEGAAAVLRHALELWRGPPLADLETTLFVRAEQARLDELRLAALEERIVADLALGRASPVIAELRQLVGERPEDERFHRQLMIALYRSGRQAEALGVYRKLRQHLASKLGLEPTPETRAIERSILNADPTLAGPKAAQPVPVDEEVDAVTVPTRRGRPASIGPRLRAVGVAAVALITAAAIGFAVRPSHSGAGTGRVVDRIPVPTPGGPFVGRLTFGAGSLWIRKSGDDQVLRIDPATGRTIARIKVGFAYDTDIAVQDGDVWVTNGEDGTVSRIDAATNSVGATIRVGSYPLGIAATDNAVWVANHHSGSVSRIDPRTNRVVSTVPISLASNFSGPLHLVLANHQLWVEDATDGAVVRVDPLRNRRTGAILQSGPACGGMTADGDSVWVASGCDEGTVTRIDAKTARVVHVIELPGVAFDVAAGVGAVWATTTNGLLVRIDPKTNRIVATRSLGDAVSLTTGNRSVWVVNRVTRSVLRLRPAD